MKNYRRIFALVLTVVLAVCLFAVPAMAATETGNGLELTLTTDKAEYTADDLIKASLTVKNTTDAAINDLVALHNIPEGYLLASDNAVKYIGSLAAGESATVDVAYKTGRTPPTGDYAIVAALAALVLSGAGLALVKKNSKFVKSTFCVFLCCVMIAGIAMPISATEEPATLSVSTVVKVDGKDVTITASVQQMEPGTYSVVEIADMKNGQVTAEKYIYKKGDTVTLNVKPNTGYSQKLTINGEPLLLDWETGKYTFVATEPLYVIGGSFEQDLVYSTDASNNRFNMINHAQGVLGTKYPLEGKTDKTSWWLDIHGEYESIAVKVKNYLSVEDSKEGTASEAFSVALRITLDNGKNYAFRIINPKEGRYGYGHYGAAGSASGWGGWKWVDQINAEAPDLINGDGVWFKLERSGDNTLKISINGSEAETYTMDGVTADNKIVSVGVIHYGNMGKMVELPFNIVKVGESVDPEPPVEPDPEIPVEPDNPVTINIAELTNGTVTTDKETYEVGETVTLTITPAEGYAQKLFINGEPLLLDWKTNTYSFVATEEVYNITGSFEPVLNLAPSDAGRWDTANQAHGVLNAYYPVNDDSWWMDIKGEYESIAVIAKNYLAVADSQDGNGKVGFAVILRVTMDNGKTYAFRVYNDKGTYAHSWYGAGGSVTGWGSWKNIHNAYAADFNGDGVEYKLERTASDKLTLSLNGTVVETYTMTGVTAENKVVSMSVQHNGNKGVKVEVPFVITKPDPRANVQLNIADFANGTVTTDKETYEVGETVTLTITPSEGYAQKLFINGEPLLLDWKTNTYSFVATEKTYDITGSFEKSLNLTPSDANRWDTANQAHGVLNTYYPANNDSWFMEIKGEYESITVKAKNYWSVDESYEGIANGGGFRIVLRATMDNGKNYAFSIWINTEKKYAYNHFGGGGSATGWGGAWCLVADKNADAVAALNGDGADFKLERIDGNHFQISINGTVLETYTIPDVTAANKVVSMGVQHNGNKGEHVAIPFVVEEPKQNDEPGASVNINIADLTNGTVTTDKESYKVGETVTLTVTPNAGYSQKLYINGEPLLLDWKTNTYSFVATEEVYNITGSFKPSINAVAKDAGRWDTANQAHGILNAYYPANDDAWWMEIKGEYASLSVLAKNYLPVADSKDGNGKVGFSVALRATMDNGKTYAFRIYNDKGTYAYSRSGASGSVSGWDHWKNIHNLADVINGEGVEFKLERTGANTLTLSVNGAVVDTYTMEGVTADNKVVSLDIAHYGNKGQHIEIPFELG